MLLNPASDFDTLVDRIYEAALVPELWPSVLDRLAELSQADGGILYAASPKTPLSNSPASPIGRWTASASITSFIANYERAGWAEPNLRVQRALKLGHTGFVTDFDLVTPEEIETEPFYKYLRQNGLGWCAWVTVPVPTSDLVLFSCERRFSDGPISRETVALLDPLRPHLARAGLVASRLGLERAKAAAETLASLGLPAAVLSPQHRMLAANGLLEALMPSVVEEHAMGRIHLADKKADRLFADALADAARGGTEKQGSSKAPVFSLPIPAKDEQPAMVVHVVPMRRAARDIFTAAASIVVITPVCPSEVPSANVIQGLFDLTPAETRVARLIVGGETVSEIAAAAKTSEGTVRNQLKSVFAKTGVSRQVDLIGLLGNLNPLR
jgi:DNA-binding CsgD family transcriptional regulator